MSVPGRVRTAAAIAVAAMVAAALWAALRPGGELRLGEGVGAVIRVTSATSVVHVRGVGGRDPESWPTVRPAWRSLENGLETAVLTLQREDGWRGVELTLLRIDPARFEFRVRVAPAGGGGTSCDAVIAAERRVAACVNGSFFSGETPIGLVVENGRRVSAPSNRMRGFVSAEPDKGFEIGFEAPGEDVTQAVQSFPLLLDDGRIPDRLRPGGDRAARRPLNIRVAARRAFIGSEPGGRVVVGVSATFSGGLTFAELARLVQAVGLKRAVGLDGGGSAQLAARGRSGGVAVAGLDRVPVVLMWERRVRRGR